MPSPHTKVIFCNICTLQMHTQGNWWIPQNTKRGFEVEREMPVGSMESYLLVGSMESYLLYTTRNLLHFIKNKSVHMPIKLYSLPYKNTIIQLSNLCLLCQNSLQTCHYYLFYLIRETGLLNSPALGFLTFLKWTSTRKNRSQHETRWLLLRRQGPVCGQDTRTICRNSQLCHNPQLSGLWAQS